MGFRQNAYARIFTYNPEQKYGTANLTISKKNKSTNEYEVEFQDGYVRFIGDAHEKAVQLGLPTKEEYDSKTDKGTTVQITSCDVTNKFDLEKKKLYVNYLVYDIELPEGNKESIQKKTDDQHVSKKTKKSDEDDELPF